jgi:hypothetical protein
MGFVGSAPGLVTLLAWSCARRQELPPSRARVRVGQWGSQRAQCSALAASVASRYAFGADGVGAARPGARGSRVTASRYAASLSPRLSACRVACDAPDLGRGTRPARDPF